jgi:bifunctional non-homologous end joining protein LigD
VKTSGSKGFHVAFALDEKSNSGQVARFAHAFGRELVRRAPNLLTQEFYKADRDGKILIDTGRNEFGATYAAPYAVRPKAGAPVSAPCTWDEVETGAARPRTFTLRTMATRLAAKGDLWAAVFEHRQALPSLS